MGAGRSSSSLSLGFDLLMSSGWTGESHPVCRIACAGNSKSVAPSGRRSAVYPMPPQQCLSEPLVHLLPPLQQWFVPPSPAEREGQHPRFLTRIEDSRQLSTLLPWSGRGTHAGLLVSLVHWSSDGAAPTFEGLVPPVPSLARVALSPWLLFLLLLLRSRVLSVWSNLCGRLVVAPGGLSTPDTAGERAAVRAPTRLAIDYLGTQPPPCWVSGVDAGLF